MSNNSYQRTLSGVPNGITTARSLGSYEPPQSHGTSQAIEPSTAMIPTGSAARDTTHSFHQNIPSHTDLQLLQRIHQNQRELVDRVQDQQRWATQRRHALSEHVAELHRRETEDLHQCDRKRSILDHHEKELLLTKSRIDVLLSRVERGRRDLNEWASLRSSEHEKTRMILEQESVDLRALERHVEELCGEIAMHAQEAEARYRRRLEEAEQARQRWEDDIREVSSVEERMKSYRVNETSAEESFQRYLSSPVPKSIQDISVSAEGGIDDEIVKIQRDLTVMEQRMTNNVDVYASMPSTSSSSSSSLLPRRPYHRAQVISPSRVAGSGLGAVAGLSTTRNNGSQHNSSLVDSSGNHGGHGGAEPEINTSHTIGTPNEASSTFLTVPRSFGGMRSPPRPRSTGS